MIPVLLILSSVDSRSGGIQRYNYSLIRMLKSAGFGPVVVSVNDTNPPDSTMTHFTGCGRNRLRLLAAVIRRSVQAPIILIGHRNFLPLVPLIRTLNPAATLVLIAHGIEVWSPQTLLYRLSARFLNQIWAVSTFTRDRVREVFHTPLPISIVPNVVPEAIRLKAETGTTDKQRETGSLVILSVSRLMKEERYKGLDLAIPAVIQWAGNRPFTWHLVLQGNDVERHRMLIADSPVADRFIIHELVSDDQLKALYSQAHVFLLPSTGEGFGIVFLEAMAHGCIAIGAETGGTPDVIADGVNGLLVPVPVTTHGIVSTLDRLSAPGFRESLVARGYSMLPRFTEPVVTRLIRKELTS